MVAASLFRSFRAWLFVPLFVLLTAITLVPGQTASARMAACRTDPIVFFKDGTKVTLRSEIGTDISDVRSVQYVLHAPHNSRVDRVVFTANALGGRETFVVYYDNYPGKYTGQTTARAAIHATVQASMKVDGPDAVTAGGWTDDDLTMEWTRPGPKGHK